MQTPQQAAALREVLRVNADLSRAMYQSVYSPVAEDKEDASRRVVLLKQEQLNARCVLAIERGLSAMVDTASKKPIPIGPTEIDAMVAYLQNREAPLS